MFTTRSDGQVVNMRVEAARLTENMVAGPAFLENRFACEARKLVTGKPRDAALGVNFYMRVDKVRPQGALAVPWPGLANGRLCGCPLCAFC
jgi:hypothetical protein